MKERVINNKRITRCWRCAKDITAGFKIKREGDNERKMFYHLTCYKRRALETIKIAKESLSEAHKSLRKLNKYNKEIILENLGGI